jgi:hypothetical protein
MSMRDAVRASGVSIGLVAVTMLLCLAAFPVGAQASPITINGTGSDFVVNYNVLTPGGDPLTATGTFDVTAFSATEATIAVTINNTDSQYVVSAIGFNTSSPVTGSYTITGSTFDGSIANDVNFPSLQTIEICAFTSANCSSSTNGDALQPTSSDSFTLKLTGDLSQGLTLSTFGIKFAGGPEGSFEGTGKVPVPGTLLLFGAGFVVFAGWHYRSRLGLSA